MKIGVTMKLKDGRGNRVACLTVPTILIFKEETRVKLWPCPNHVVYLTVALIVSLAPTVAATVFLETQILAFAYKMPLRSPFKKGIQYTSGEYLWCNHDYETSFNASTNTIMDQNPYGFLQSSSNFFNSSS